MTAAHRWETTSSHVTSDGWVRYQACLCGLTRVLLNAEPIGVAARNDPPRREVVDEHDHGG
ncbi:hypothetical protein [Actinophytocola gossypii]|uniref:Uncharacterized protein n=1 Tax=Actinophytocola gossypii TaxID=2812003 RepID=A0ABT2J6V4_9PSEU|nr:hypothetical protein [Actinophytocola gossypii]MCT2583339.1 hypothetical protein [Actinophytocola gossypii]